MVGVFDSGLGGLTVVKEIVKRYPKEDFVYLGDTARVPYGTRSAETIIKFSVECAGFLEKQGVDKIIIACNTASAYAYNEIVKVVKVPVWEVISFGAKGASFGKKIGVIGTRATIKSGMYENKIKELNPDAQVVSVETPLLVPLIEEGETDGKIMEETVKKYITELNGVDTLVLGCTHYPAITKILKNLLLGVRLVNPSEELAKEWNGGKGNGIARFYFTDLPVRYIEVAEMFLGKKLTGKVAKVIL